MSFTHGRPYARSYDNLKMSPSSLLSLPIFLYVLIVPLATPSATCPHTRWKTGVIQCILHEYHWRFSNIASVVLCSRLGVVIQLSCRLATQCRHQVTYPLHPCISSTSCSRPAHAIRGTTTRLSESLLRVAPLLRVMLVQKLSGLAASWRSAAEGRIPGL